MDLIKGCQPIPQAASCEGCKTTREPRVCQSSPGINSSSYFILTLFNIFANLFSFFCPDCGDAQECFEGLCRFLCMRDSECIVGEKCLDGFCVPVDIGRPDTSSKFEFLTYKKYLKIKKIYFYLN